MNPADIALRLRANILTFQGLTLGVSDEQARWKPSLGAWSILEVVNHLADEEAGDFRMRLDLTLHRPGETWPGIDPPAWAVERAYNERELVPSVGRFVEERVKSLDWLEGLEAPDWDRDYGHPKLGRIRAGDLLVAWVAHDLIHVRQINRLHRQWLETTGSGPYSPAYAGDW